MIRRLIAITGDVLCAVVLLEHTQRASETKRALRKCIRAHIDYIIRMWFIEISLTNKKYICIVSLVPNSFIYFHLHINYFITRLSIEVGIQWCEMSGINSGILLFFWKNWSLLWLRWNIIDLNSQNTHEESTSFICHKININWQINEEIKKRKKKKIKKKKARPSNKIVFIFYLIISIFKYTNICLNEWILYKHTVYYIVSYTQHMGVD